MKKQYCFLNGGNTGTQAEYPLADTLYGACLSCWFCWRPWLPGWSL